MNPSFVRSIVLAALLAGCGGSSTEPEPEAGGAGASDQATTGAEAEPELPMPTSEFIGMVAIEAVPEVCADTSPLRTCYPSTDAALCATGFTQAMLACGEAMADALPPTVDAETLEPVAGAVASCARVAFQNGLEEAGIERAADCALER